MATVAVVALVLALVTAACTGGGHGGKSTTTPTSAAPSRTADPQAADARLILTMYDNINRAFQRNPDDGVRAIIAAQDPEDRVDVDFARCVNAIIPGAKTLPASKKLRFVPNIATMTPDSGYVLTSNRVTGLHPKGRVYVTDVTITEGKRPVVRARHQVVLDGKAYQFSQC
jgi:hypothetical protein